MDSLVSCVSIIAPDGSPIYLRKYQNPSSAAQPKYDTLELESIIFNALLTIQNKKLFSNLKELPPPVQSHVIEVPNFPQSPFSVYAAKFPLKYILLIITYRKVSNDQTITKCSCSIADELFTRISDPFYSPFSPLDKSELFNTNIDKIARSLIA